MIVPRDENAATAVAGDPLLRSPCDAQSIAYIAVGAAFTAMHGQLHRLLAPAIRNWP